MKRTKPEQVRSPLFQLYKFAHHFLYTGCVKNLSDGLFADHFLGTGCWELGTGGGLLVTGYWHLVVTKY